jgi:hypothetical protein
MDTDDTDKNLGRKTKQPRIEGMRGTQVSAQQQGANLGHPAYIYSPSKNQKQPRMNTDNTDKSFDQKSKSNRGLSST